MNMLDKIAVFKELKDFEDIIENQAMNIPHHLW